MIDLATAKPREIESYLREVIRKSFGDAVENKAEVFARSGYFTVNIELDGGKSVGFDNFRRGDAKRVAKALRALIPPK